MSSHATAPPSAATHRPPLLRRQLGSTGLEVSVLGFGASPLGGVFQSIDENVGIAAVETAFARGINFFDTSPYYGLNRSETVLGKGLARLPRDQIVVATKVGRYGGDEFDFSAERVERSVQESLQRLGLERLDLVQCHDIEFGDLNVVLRETLPTLTKLKHSGVVGAIGITGLPLGCLSYVLEHAAPGSIDVVLSYCHYTLCDRSMLREIPKWKAKGVGVINASPLCMGLLTPQGPPEWHPAAPELREAAAKAAEIAAELGASLPRIAIKDAVKNEEISSTLVGLCTPEQVHENCDAVLEALGALESGAGAEQAEQTALAKIEKIFEPVMDMTWPSGRPENDKREAKLS